jgi:D-alanyl-D-alanine carboxypeptidase-like protein
VVVLAACSGSAAQTARGKSDTGSTALRSSTSTTSTAAPATAVPTTATPDSFSSAVTTVTSADLGASWHLGCPVPPESLRMVTVTFIGFDGIPHTGQVVVNADVTDAVVEVFHRLYDARFPIRMMKPIFTQAEFDDFETPDDNSTGFSCRDAVTDSGTSSWSEHAYGHAIDIDPIENPYVESSRIIPAAGAAFLDRSDVRPGMAVEGSAIVDAFRAVGWGWGATFRDYQHFSTNGR